MHKNLEIVKIIVTGEKNTNKIKPIVLFQNLFYWVAFFMKVVKSIVNSEDTFSLL